MSQDLDLTDEVFLKRKAARHTLLIGALQPQGQCLSHSFTSVSRNQVCCCKGGAGFEDVLET